MPARYIFLLIFWVKFSSGLFGKIRPPPRHSGEEVMPARARPGALLAERLLGRVLDLLAVLLGARALAGIGLEGHDDLVHQRFVVVAAEHGVGGVELRRCLALLVQEFELHYLAPFAVGAALQPGP